MKRRDYMKFLRGGLIMAGAVSISGGTREKYDVLDIPTNGSRKISISDNETIENLVVDIRAHNADACIVARGSGWVIRDVIFVGSTDLGAESGGFSNLVDAQGNGRIENVYMGDGVSNDGIWRGGIGVGTSHSGHIDIRDCYLAGWTDNAVYAATMAEEQLDSAGYGTITIDRCYLQNNNIAHLRIASDGTLVRNTVIENTNDTHTIDGGPVNSRGIYTGYGGPEQVVSIKNCDICVTPENTNGIAHALVSGTHDRWGPCSTLNVVESNIEGEVVGHVVINNDGDFSSEKVPNRSHWIPY